MSIKRHPEYLDMIREQYCSVYDCAEKRSDPHHVGTGGGAMKCSDFFTVPLCRKHHAEFGNMGRWSFYSKYPHVLFMGFRLLSEHAEEMSEFIETLKADIKYRIDNENTPF